MIRRLRETPKSSLVIQHIHFSSGVSRLTRLGLTGPRASSQSPRFATRCVSRATVVWQGRSRSTGAFHCWLLCELGSVLNLPCLGEPLHSRRLAEHSFPPRSILPLGCIIDFNFIRFVLKSASYLLLLSSVNLFLFSYLELLLVAEVTQKMKLKLFQYYNAYNFYFKT